MSWFSKSLTGLLRDADDEFNANGSSRNEEEEHSKSVKEDLSELGRQLWGGVASFLAPPPEVAKDFADVEIVEKEHLTDDHQEELQEKPGEAAVQSSSPKLAGVQSDLAELKGGFAKGLSRLSSVIREVVEPGSDTTTVPEKSKDGNGDDGNKQPSLPSRIVSGIDGISKLASSIFPFVQEEDGDELWEAPGITDEVVGFARNISRHPETWLDFPQVSDEENGDVLFAGFEMNSAQQDHIDAIQRVASRLEALRCELCPQHMSEERFWKIYFVLLHSRLSVPDASLLSTPQVLEARKVLLDHLKQREISGPPSVNAQGVCLTEADDSSVIDKDAIESTIKLATYSGEEAEAEADEWLESDPGIEIAPTKVTAAAPSVDNNDGNNNEEDISFSDLEEEEDACSSKEHGEQASIGGSSSRATQDWVQLDSNRGSSIGSSGHERAGSKGSNDWLTVDQEDAGAGATTTTS